MMTRLSGIVGGQLDAQFPQHSENHDAEAQ